MYALVVVSILFSAGDTLVTSETGLNPRILKYWSALSAARWRKGSKGRNTTSCLRAQIQPVERVQPSPRRIALEISGALRASELSIMTMEALVVGNSKEIHGFYHVGVVEDSELDLRNLAAIRSRHWTKAVVAEPLLTRAVAGSNEFVSVFGRFFRTQWNRVVGAHQLVRKYEADHPQEGPYGLMVRLRTDTLFYRRFDFEYLSKEMGGLNPGREWLALPQGLLGGCRHCTVTSLHLAAAERFTDMVAVGTPAAMDVYASPFNETHVDSLPIDTENYITLVLRKFFYFPGSAASGDGVYGGAISGDSMSGFSNISCARPGAAMETYPVQVNRKRWPAARSKPKICTDINASFLLYHFRACGMSMARYKVHINDLVPIHASNRGGYTPDSDVLHTWSNKPVLVSTACPVGVEPTTTTRTTTTTTSLGTNLTDGGEAMHASTNVFLSSQAEFNGGLSCTVRGRYSIPCSEVCLQNVTIPEMPAELRALFRDRHAMKRECMRRLDTDPKFGKGLVGFSGRDARTARKNGLGCVGADYWRGRPNPPDAKPAAREMKRKKRRPNRPTHRGVTKKISYRQ
jgi:hypothetical protein